MKKKSPVIEFYRVVRWKKHLKQVANKREEKQRRKAYFMKLLEAKKKLLPSYEKLPTDGFRLASEFSELCSSCEKPQKRFIRTGQARFQIPKGFDIYENTETVFKTLAKFRELGLTKRINGINVIHNAVRTCMSSEALLGILGSEIDELRKFHDARLQLDGEIYDTQSGLALIENMGIPAELEEGTIYGEPACPPEHIFWFTKDNKQFESASLSADDIKNDTAEGCVNQLSLGLQKLLLRLNKDVASELKMCLGEILDNAHEHCHRTSPTWYVRSYLNTNAKHERYFELMVLNLGASIAETFNRLPDDSDAKADVRGYANAHNTSFSEEALTTVAALQGNVSSKKDDEYTRGQGTIRLIETFENISRDYVQLRGKGANSKKNEPIMNIISGSTIINFNGKYHSYQIKHKDGSEDVRISFNKESSLKFPPDPSCVQTMKNVYFPGVMINIRIPLNGSTTPIKENA